MSRTKMRIGFWLPTISVARVNDCLSELTPILEKHRASGILATIKGPYEDQERENGKASDQGNAGSGRLERAEPGDERSRAARDAFAEPAAPAAEPPKRGRGRPRKSDTADAGSSASSGPPAEGRQRADSAASPDRREGSQRNEPERAREGSDTRSRQGEGRSGGAERGRDDQRGNREAPRVEPADEWGDSPADWAEEITGEEGEEFHAKTPGDDWPDHLMPAEPIDKATLGALCGDHYKATGGKDKGLTFALLERITGTRQLNQVAEKDYDILAQALLKDTARYQHGVKKPL